MAATVGPSGTGSAVSTYDFRCNAEYGETTIRSMLADIAKHWVFQREIGDSGYDHYQGRLSLVKKRRVAELKGKWSSITSYPMPNYLQPTCNPEHLTGSFSYVMKNDSRTEGPWCDVDEVVFIPYQYKGMLEKFYPWQTEVFESARLRNSRTINLVYCPEGCTGKSTVTHVCDLFASAIVVPPVNDAEKLVQSVHSMCATNKIRDPRLVFIDLPRAMDKAKLGGIYSAIEQIKNGYLYDMRYKFSKWYIDSPQVWVFTNIHPSLSMLSLDRWIIRTIKDHHLVPYDGIDSHPIVDVDEETTDKSS